jgi:DNA-directed RNA polymerase specialized sigma24 family protein
VLGILRNRGYPGEVSFRDARHRPRRRPHRPRHRALHARRRIPDRSPRTWPAPRVRDLGNKVRARRGRHAELGEAAETADLEPPTAANIEALRQLLDDEIERRNEEHRKAIAQAFVSDLVVKERDTIQPTF